MEKREWKTIKEYQDILFEFYNGIAKKFVDAGYDIRDVDDYITRGIYDGIAYDNKIEYKENKQWALDHIASSSTDKEDDLTEDEILFPTALRPASFGRTDLGDKKGNFAVVNSDGSLSAKRGDELLDAFDEVIDFSKYDSNHDGYVDSIYLVYALVA